MAKQEERWAIWVQVLAGVWLIMSPWVLGYRETQIAMVNDVIIGLIISVIALIQMAAIRKPSKKKKK